MIEFMKTFIVSLYLQGLVTMFCLKTSGCEWTGSYKKLCRHHISIISTTLSPFHHCILFRENFYFIHQLNSNWWSRDADHKHPVVITVLASETKNHTQEMCTFLQNEVVSSENVRKKNNFSRLTAKIKYYVHKSYWRPWRHFYSEKPSKTV